MRLVKRRGDGAPTGQKSHTRQRLRGAVLAAIIRGHMAAPGPLARHWTLDPAVTFLNHGSFGACPRAVLAKQDEWRARLERQPVRLMARELEGLLDEARAAKRRDIEQTEREEARAAAAQRVAASAGR